MDTQTPQTSRFCSIACARWRRRDVCAKLRRSAAAVLPRRPPAADAPQIRFLRLKHAIRRFWRSHQEKDSRGCLWVLVLVP